MIYAKTKRVNFLKDSLKKWGADYFGHNVFNEWFMGNVGSNLSHPNARGFYSS
jgi:hypothetical protein